MTIYVFNKEELEWIDTESCIISDDETPPDYSKIAESLYWKLRKSWEQSQKEDQYELDLTDEEIDYIYEMIYDIFWNDCYGLYSELKFVNGKPRRVRKEVIKKEDYEDWLFIKQGLDLTNSIFKKFKKLPLKIEKLEKEMEEARQKADSKLKVRKEVIKKEAYEDWKKLKKLYKDSKDSND